MNDLKLLKELDSTVQSMIHRFRLPAGFQTKSFMRAYWSIAHPNGKKSAYLPRFDGLSLRQMRVEMEKCLGRDRVDEVLDDEIAPLFRKTMQKILSDLEQDIANVS